MYTREPAFNPGPGFLLGGGLQAKVGPRTGRQRLLDPARAALLRKLRGSPAPAQSEVGPTENRKRGPAFSRWFGLAKPETG